MRNKIFIVLVILLAIFILRLSSAQNEDGSAIVGQGTIDGIFQKLQTISSQLSIISEKDALMAKLDQVLANQQKIFEELNIIKVRSTRR